MSTAQVLRDQFWHLLCHRAELPKNGDYVRLNWLDQEVVLFNDGGDIVVFDNRCPHRGVRFFSEDHGNGAISCPYHGWGYRNGALHIPCREHYDPAVLEGVKLGKLQSEWCADFLFVSLAPRMSLEEQLGPTYDQLATISFNIVERADFNVGYFECDWQVAVENALEPLHVPYVHPETLGLLGLAEDDNTLHEWTSVLRAKISDEPRFKKLRSIKRLFNIDEQFEGYQSIFMFPFSMLSTTFGYSYSLQNFFPTAEPHRTHFRSRLYTAATKSPAAAEALQPFFASSAQVNRQVFDEDHAICRRVAHDFRSSGAGLLAPGEEKIGHFRACLARVEDSQ